MLTLLLISFVFFPYEITKITEKITIKVLDR